jgi:ribosomal protein L18E
MKLFKNILVLALLFSSQASAKIDYNRGMNPGMALRLE